MRTVSHMSFTRNKLAAALGPLQTDVTAIADAELKATVADYSIWLKRCLLSMRRSEKKTSN
ncbi:MAG: hypothetical protein V3V22_00995 [Methylococcales bacterium]